MPTRFEHRFEGRDVLDGLLELSGSALDSQEVLARFVAGHQAGEPASALIPTLFDGEPRFPDPEIARRLYQNLLGLWDLVASGKTVVLDVTKRKKEKKEKPAPPPPYDAAPDAAYVEAAWRYLEELPEGDVRTLERLHHAFENRQDALLQYLEEQGLSDDAYATARYLLFELFAMLELGRPEPLRSVSRKELDAAPTDDSAVPEALRTYVDEALFEAEQDEETPLSSTEAAKVRGAVSRGLHALWRARSEG